MNTKTRIKSVYFLNWGLAIALLASLGTTAAMPSAANAETWDSSMNPSFISTTQNDPDVELNEKLAQFEQYLAEMQRELAIPGMSVAIVKDQELLWAQGFGYADVEARRPATADTPYEIASLTKTLSSTILLQLVEQGKVNLDDPVSKYGVYIKSPGVIRVRHLLGMTSLGEPGSFFAYSGDRYTYLQKVIERASGRSFPSLLIENILTPLGMSNSAPIDMLDQPDYTHIGDNLSKPYGMDRTYIGGFTTAAGLISTALDLAKFDIALDQDQLIDPATRSLAFTAQTLTSGDPPVYGMGWFVQEFAGTEMAWVFGYDAFTHLYLKFVNQGYTLIVLTNSTTFGDYISMRDPNVMRYPAALAFYKLFFLGTGLADTVDWDADDEAIAAQLQAAQEAGYGEIARQEIHDRYLTDRILEKTAAAQETLDTYAPSFATAEPPDFTMQPPLAIIDRVGTDTYSIIEFTLEQDTRFNIYAVGEYWLGKMVDYGGIEDVSSGELIWSMTPDRTSPAGGNVINRQETDQIDLQAGTYRLHYRTDWDHSFGHWDALPPDNLFWGIALYSIGAQPNVVTRTIVPTAEDELLAGLLPLTGTPVISNLEYAILWVYLGILLSALLFIPVLLYRKKRPVEATIKARRWTKAAGWAAWVNSLLCLVQVAVMLLRAGNLEYMVENPLMLVSNSPGIAWAFVGVTYVCIALTIIQALFAILVWKGKQRPLAERIYYSLATLAAAGYILLLASWGLITALY